jgi:CRISPR-associated protein Cas2
LGSGMQTYVIYDIVRDGIRKRISEACLDFGLQRIQYSAFRGNMNATRRNALEKRLAKELGKQEGKIEIIVVCEKDFRQRSVIEGREEGKGSRGEGEKAGE